MKLGEPWILLYALLHIKKINFSNTKVLNWND